MTDESNHWVSKRTYFVLMSVFLLLLTTSRFSGDLAAFSWSLIVLGVVIYYDD